MKTVRIVTEMDLGGQLSFKVYANETKARQAVRATEKAFAHMSEYEVLK